MITNDSNVEVIIVILISSVIWLFLYQLLSKIENNSIHVLTPALLTFFPTCYFFEFIYAFNSTKKLNLNAYFYYFSMYTVAFAALFLGYVIARHRKMIIYRNMGKTVYEKELQYLRHRQYFILSLLFSVVAIIIYVPVIIEFREYILYPRKIYELTRTGYGLSFFLSNLSSLLAILCCIYFVKNERLVSFVLITINCILILLHGSKTPILSVFFMMILYAAVIKNKKYNLWYVFLFILLMASVMFLFFLYTYNITPKLVFGAMAGYSDYTRNAIVLYESNYTSQLGRLLFETEIFSRVPRFFFPSKPNDFGYLELAKNIFPKSFYLNQGAPSFGFGVYYADFGAFTHLYVFIVFFMKGVLSGIFRNQLFIDKNIYVFLPYLFLSGVEVLALGTGWLFFEHLSLAFCLFVFMWVLSRLFYGNRKSI